MFTPNRVSRAQFRLSKCRRAGAFDTCCNRTVAGAVDERLCPFTQKTEIDVLDAALPRTFQVWSGDPIVCMTAYFTPSLNTRGLRDHASFRGPSTVSGGSVFVWWCVVARWRASWRECAL